ncbi:MAG: HAMP domain-containing protein [Planctomycetes bacterium]|nr:HAMP domain-containing protein [Planctomycetota bacterium]
MRQGHKQSRVGRRIVLSFALFALLPLLLFAYHASREVASELRAAASERLDQDLKTAGVTFFERLMVAQRDAINHREGLARDSDLLGTFRPVDPAVVDADLSARLDRHGAVLVSAEEEGEIVLDFVVRRRDGSAWSTRVDMERLCAADGLDRPPASLAIFEIDGRLVRQVGQRPLAGTELLRAGLGHRAKASFECGSGEEACYGAYWEVFMSPQFGKNLAVALIDSEARAMAPLESYRRDLIHVVALTILAVVFASLVRVRRIMGPFQSLIAATERIGRQERGVRVDLAGQDEFALLGGALNEMAATLEHRAEFIRSANEFGRGLATELDPRRLVRKLMTGAANMLRVDGVAVHLRERDGRLALGHLKLRSSKVEIVSDQESCSLHHLPGDLLGPEPVVIDSIENSDHPVAVQIRAICGGKGAALREALIMPMTNHEGLVVGALTLFDPVAADGEPRRLDEETLAAAGSLAGQASVGIENSRLRGEFKALFDSMADVLAVAVDQKSPYTGAHCRRVPKIAMMLFDEVDRAAAGPFAPVTFDADQTYEMQIASLLHDCGKVVTPVHVVDKATKLETIWDRIQLIDQRFELVLRERELALLRRQAESGRVDLEALRVEFEELAARAASDRDFLRRANVGGEFMKDEDVARVDAISSFWAYRDPEGREQDFLSEDEKLNLKIRRGTLTEAERQIINYHMDATIMMLEQLPFPRRLAQVPAIAGAHHERMDGKGFPKGLRGEEIPLQGRMLAIADVFEALTAVDRPYKKGMGLAQSLKIMSFMAKEGHLDPDLFELFLDTGIWRRYGDEVLSEAQRDAVEVEALRGIFRVAQPC